MIRAQFIRCRLALIVFGILDEKLHKYAGGGASRVGTVVSPGVSGGGVHRQTEPFRGIDCHRTRQAEALVC